MRPASLTSTGASREAAEIRHSQSRLTLFAAILVGLAGIADFFSVGQLKEDDFAIKVAVVSTPYPGATPTEVERAVTDRIESKLQELRQVHYLAATHGRRLIAAFL